MRFVFFVLGNKSSTNTLTRFDQLFLFVSLFQIVVVLMDAAIEQYAPDETRGDSPSVCLTLPYSIHPSCLHMQVRSGSKTKNLVPFVTRKFLGTDENAASVEQVTWNAFADGIGKAIACAEMTKRRSTAAPLFEYVQIGYKRVEHLWKPVNGNIELDTLKVNRDIPAICILLSKIPLSPILNEGDK